MTITKAELIAAREAVMTIPKEAQTQWSGNEAASAYEARYNGADSPKYWIDSYNKAKEAGDKRSLKQFIEDEFKKYVDATDQYKKDVRAGGGMIDRYTGSAGMVGGVLGALLGGLVGGGKGAAIGGILGALGLYAIQKLGIFDGTEVGEMLKNGVDKIYGDPVTPEEITQVEKAGQDALKQMSDKLKQQAETGEEPSPATDPEMWGETDPTSPDYNAGVAAAAPPLAFGEGVESGDMLPKGPSIQEQRIDQFGADSPDSPMLPKGPSIQAQRAAQVASVQQIAADQYGVDISPEQATAVIDSVMPGADLTPEAVGAYIQAGGLQRPVAPREWDKGPEALPPEAEAALSESPIDEAPVELPAPTTPGVAPVVPTSTAAAALKETPVLEPPVEAPAPPEIAVRPLKTKIPRKPAPEQLVDPNIAATEAAVDAALREPVIDDRPRELKAPVPQKPALAAQLDAEGRAERAAAAKAQERANSVARARENLRLRKSVIGRWRDPVRARYAGVKSAAKDIGEGLMKPVESFGEGLGLSHDLGELAGRKTKEYGKRASIAAGEATEAAKAKAQDFARDTQKFLSEKAKDLRYLFKGE
jgi:hypothetical protein